MATTTIRPTAGANDGRRAQDQEDFVATHQAAQGARARATTARRVASRTRAAHAAQEGGGAERTAERPGRRPRIWRAVSTSQVDSSTPRWQSRAKNPIDLRTWRDMRP